MRGRFPGVWTKVLLVTLLTVPINLAGSGARAAGILDLTTKSGINSYLISKGVDPASVVWQRSLLNYAGPSCPGVAWNCVGTKAPVVQLALPGGTNLFSCRGTDCLVVQTSTSSSKNSAQCNRSGQDESQTCDVTQNNSKSTNSANIEQTIVESGGCDQTATESASINQTNASGANHATIQQRIRQSSKSSRGACGTQSQGARQGARVMQTSDSGNNDSNIDQSQKQTEIASGGDVITQEQNAATDTTEPCVVNALKNQCAEVEQNSNTGDQDSTLNQDIDQQQNASNTGTLSQTQGNPDGGSGGSVDQDSTGVSISHADETNIQDVLHTNVVTANRTMDTGDPRCCQFQTGNPDDQGFITQTTDQSSSPPGATQNARLAGDCFSDGTCTLTQSATTDYDSETFSDSQPGSEFNVIECTGSTSEGDCESFVPET